nr:response regulator [candidate division Zixibacteria bacterium]
MPKILVVDDEAHIRKLYNDFLKREGYQVETAAGGDEALEVLAKSRFDLVILDIELGDEASGLDILKRIKAGYPDLAVILNTAYSIYQSDFSIWIADAYIMKSSDISQLKDKVQELVGT